MGAYASLSLALYPMLDTFPGSQLKQPVLVRLAIVTFRSRTPADATAHVSADAVGGFGMVSVD